MSLNNSINGVIAYIEDRPDIAREIFRAADSDVENIPAVLARLDRAVNKAAATAIRNALQRSLGVQANEIKIMQTYGGHQKLARGGFNPEAATDVFLLGVREVEKVLEDILVELEGKYEPDY